MNSLSIVFIFKISATLLFWCVPLLLLPSTWLLELGLPPQENWMFLRMLGWAYLALCVGYGFGLRAALRHQAATGPVWVGIVSNGGAFLYLAYYGVTGAWQSWGLPVQVVGWGSVSATFAITLGLWRFGLCVPALGE